MICTNLVYITIEIYIIVFIGIMKVIHLAFSRVQLIMRHILTISFFKAYKNASLPNPRDAFIMIYLFNYGQQHLKAFSCI